jgi:hypothetical protein
MKKNILSLTFFSFDLFFSRREAFAFLITMIRVLFFFIGAMDKKKRQIKCVVNIATCNGRSIFGLVYRI